MASNDTDPETVECPICGANKKEAFCVNVPDCPIASEITYKIGRWLSAALEDPQVCEEMKVDIRAWMEAGQPNVQPGETMKYDLCKNDPHILLHWFDVFQIANHEESKKWWIDRDGNSIERNKGEMLALIHSEISEALEGVRKNLKDDHLPQYSMEIVELADAVIRIFDYAEGHKLGALGPVILNKLLYNRQREDHKREVREQAHGKKF